MASFRLYGQPFLLSDTFPTHYRVFDQSVQAGGAAGNGSGHVITDVAIIAVLSGGCGATVCSGAGGGGGSGGSSTRGGAGGG